MGYHSSIELVYDASAPSRPHLVEADGAESAGAGAGRHHGHGGGRGRHVRSRSDSHALPGSAGMYGAVATEQRRRSGLLRRSKSLVQSDGDEWDENMTTTEEEPHDHDHDDVLVADQRYDGEGGVEVTRQPSSSSSARHDGGSVWGAPIMADATNFGHWVYQPEGASLHHRQGGAPRSAPRPRVQRKFSQSQLQTPHLIPADEPPTSNNDRPRSIIRNKKRRPPSPDPPPHLLGGYIYDDDLDEEEDGPAPHASNQLDASSISAEDIDDNQTFLGECLGMMDNACDLAPLCRNVTWMGPDVVTETWTRPIIKKHEVGRFFYQRDDYREFKMQYRLRTQNGEDSDDDSTDSQQPPVRTTSPSEMEYDYCSASAAAAQAEAALCGASEAFWSCFPSSASSSANTEGTSAA